MGSQPIDWWLPGAIASRRRQATRRSLVFRVEEAEESRRALEFEDYRLQFDRTVIKCLDVSEKPDPVEVCADAVARALLDGDRAGTRQNVHRSELLSVQSCRELIHNSLAKHSPESFEKQFGLKFEWAQRAINRLDERFPEAPLSPEHLELLSQLA
ncbi:hypothetical protein GCM10007857_07700 [Bradyrhizobium iriomotense]|uniref:Uncharacterized protein n=2 Tax=Bradyrhizobium iriomotense TaxID=441950 RepID=A0ABQ6ARL9_9BRAD|nr:hypothetical protein GCM10007857_07700 [Bradyrhizobium iriomotense]